MDRGKERLEKLSKRRRKAVELFERCGHRCGYRRRAGPLEGIATPVRRARSVISIAGGNGDSFAPNWGYPKKVYMLTRTKASHDEIDLYHRKHASGTLVAMSILCILDSLMVTSCATAEPSVTVPDDLTILNVDPLECTGISIKKDVIIKKEVIQEPSVMQNRFMIVLRYREGGDEKEVTPSLMPGYINISFVNEVEQTKDIPLIIHQRYCVIEVWRLYSKNNRKVCYLWNIGDRDVSMKLMLEDIGGRFLSERHVPLREDDVSQLKAYYLRLMKVFVESLQEAPPTS